MFSENQTDLVELTDKKDSDIEMGEVTSTNNKTHSNSNSHNNNSQNQIDIFLNNINYIVSYFNQNPFDILELVNLGEKVFTLTNAD